MSQALSLRKGPEDLWAPSSHLSELVIDSARPRLTRPPRQLTSHAVPRAQWLAAAACSSSACHTALSLVPLLASTQETGSAAPELLQSPSCCAQSRTRTAAGWRRPYSAWSCTVRGHRLPALTSPEPPKCHAKGANSAARCDTAIAENQIGAAGASALAEALSPQQHKDGSFVFPSRLQSLRLISTCCLGTVGGEGEGEVGEGGDACWLVNLSVR